jgi:hypothetical protein
VTYSPHSPRTWKAALLVLPAWRSKAIRLLYWRSLECVLRLVLFSISYLDGFSKISLDVHSIRLETFSLLHWTVFDTLAGTRVGSFFYYVIYSILRCLHQLVRIFGFAQSSFDMTCWESSVSVFSNTFRSPHTLRSMFEHQLIWSLSKLQPRSFNDATPYVPPSAFLDNPSTLRFTSSWLSQTNPSGLWFSAYSIRLLHCDSRYSLLSLFCVINTVITTEHNTWPKASLLSDPGFVQTL